MVVRLHGFDRVACKCVANDLGGLGLVWVVGSGCDVGTNRRDRVHVCGDVGTIWRDRVQVDWGLVGVHYIYRRGGGVVVGGGGLVVALDGDAGSDAPEAGDAVDA